MNKKYESDLEAKIGEWQTKFDNLNTEELNDEDNEKQKQITQIKREILDSKNNFEIRLNEIKNATTLESDFYYSFQPSNLVIDEFYLGKLVSMKDNIDSARASAIEIEIVPEDHQDVFR